MDRDEAPPTAFYTRINRALHTVAAHLHRYCSELKSLEETIISLRCHQDSLTGCIEELQGSRGERIIRGYEQVLSQIKASTYLATELEKKSTNILALVLLFV
jgi:prefoldin subunit 5